MGAFAEPESNLRRPDAARVHDGGRPSGTANRAAPPGRAAGRSVTIELPGTSLIRQFDTHRLVPSKHAQGGESVLARIADDDRHLADLFDLDHATNDRLLAENGRLPGLARHELVFGVPYFRIVNAA